MTISRRAFLTVLTSIAASLPMARLGFASDVPVLKAEAGMAQLGPEGEPKTAIWGYDRKVPGPMIRLKQGERVRRRFVNQLPQPSTVHWHGIRIEYPMDGVPGLTQPLVQPGADFVYDFEVPDAGNYWYHPHNRTWEQQAHGLYGP